MNTDVQENDVLSEGLARLYLLVATPFLALFYGNLCGSLKLEYTDHWVWSSVILLIVIPIGMMIVRHKVGGSVYKGIGIFYVLLVSSILLSIGVEVEYRRQPDIELLIISLFICLAYSYLAITTDKLLKGKRNSLVLYSLYFLCFWFIAYFFYLLSIRIVVKALAKAGAFLYDTTHEHETHNPHTAYHSCHRRLCGAEQWV